MTTDTQRIRYEVIGRAVVQDNNDRTRHYLKLLYCGDDMPWWVCSASMELPIAGDFSATPGQFITLTVEVQHDD